MVKLGDVVVAFSIAVRRVNAARRVDKSQLENRRGGERRAVMVFWNTGRFRSGPQSARRVPCLISDHCMREAPTLLGFFYIPSVAHLPSCLSSVRFPQWLAHYFPFLEFICHMRDSILSLQLQHPQKSYTRSMLPSVHAQSFVLNKSRSGSLTLAMSPLP